jgi:hypothetical protein
MEPDVIEQGLDRLETIQEELEEIKERTASPKRSFVNGVLSGAGAIIGGLIALAVLGWILSILGVIPGLGELASYLNGITDKFNSRY